MNPTFTWLPRSSPPHHVCMPAFVCIILAVASFSYNVEPLWASRCFPQGRPTVGHRNRVQRPECLQVWTRWHLPPCSYVCHRKKWAPRSHCDPVQSCGTTWGWGPRSEPGYNWPGCTHRTERTSAAPAHPAALDTSGSPLTNLCSRPLQEERGQEMSAQDWTGSKIMQKELITMDINAIIHTVSTKTTVGYPSRGNKRKDLCIKSLLLVICSAYFCP